VCYDDANVSGRIADINDTLIGRNAALPDTYTLTAEALAQLMNTWRARA
jgi:hypothetical protein